MERVAFIVCLLYSVLCTLGATTVNYTADNAIFPNPERGFITMLEGKKKNKNPYHAVFGKESYLTKHQTNDKGSLILVLYYIDDFKDKEVIPDSVLNAFDKDMQVLRNYGMKCILRFAYTNEDYKKVIAPGDTVRTAIDAPLSIIEKHLAQYKSRWKANADVIFTFQAGFIGQYGEWYYTENFTNKSSHITTERKLFLDTLLKAVPENRAIQLRTPLFKTEYLEAISASAAALTPEEAFSGSPKARLGHHNDAFLNGKENQGTYRDTAKQKPYIAQETLFVPIGGESNITKDDQASLMASYDLTVAEMSRLHWTFIQSGYSKNVTNMWRENHTFDTLNKYMGYRYQLLSATLPDKAKAGDKMTVKLQIKNTGYAPLYNERPVYLVLKNSSKTYSLPLQTDPRRWLPNGTVTTVEEQVTLPSSVKNGTYQFYLFMPDAYASLAGDSRYSVRFANTGVWEESTGMNKLNASIVVSKNSEDPPTGLDDCEAEQQDGQAYDILGRPVDENYHGMVIRNGKKIIQ